MDINDPRDLHAALSDLAATTPDEPGLLSEVHRDARRSHRRRAALVGGSALVVVGGAVAAAAGGFPSTGRPLLPASAPQTTTTVKPADAAPQPAMCGGGAAAAAPAGADPTIVSWTGGPPAVGQNFKVTGTVTAATASTVTVALDSGNASGTVTLSTQKAPLPSGASVSLGGTRTGQDAYEVTSIGITVGGHSEGFNATSASSVGGGAASAPAGAAPTIVSWTGGPPAVGQNFKVTGTVTAATAGTVTVALNGGDASGTVTLTTQKAPLPSGATVELGGTRTAQDAYEITSMGTTSGGMGAGFDAGSASSAAGGGAAAPSGAAPTIVSWTGGPPAVGQNFNVTGTVTAATAGTVTVALNGGDASGTVTLTTPSTSRPAPVPSGATVALAGTRTGQDAYEITSMGITSGGMGAGFNAGSASSVAGGGAAARAGATPPIVCVGPGASVRTGTAAA
jgi:hypothetical protein